MMRHAGDTAPNSMQASPNAAAVDMGLLLGFDGKSPHAALLRISATSGESVGSSLVVLGHIGIPKRPRRWLAITAHGSLKRSGCP